MLSARWPVGISILGVYMAEPNSTFAAVFGYSTFNWVVTTIGAVFTLNNVQSYFIIASVVVAMAGTLYGMHLGRRRDRREEAEYKKHKGVG